MLVDLINLTLPSFKVEIKAAFDITDKMLKLFNVNFTVTFLMLIGISWEVIIEDSIQEKEDI